MQFDWQEYINNTEKFWLITERFLQGLKKHDLPLNEMAKCEAQSRKYMQKCIESSDIFLRNFDKHGGGGTIIHILSPVHSKMIMNRLRETFGAENIWQFEASDYNEAVLDDALSLSIQYGSQQYSVDFDNVYADEMDCMSVLQDAVIKSHFAKGETQQFYNELKEALWLAQRDRLLEHIQMRQNMLKMMSSKPSFTDKAVGNLVDSIHVYLECQKRYPNTTAYRMLGECDDVLGSIAENMEDYVFVQKNLKTIQQNLSKISENMKEANNLASAPVLQKTR